MNDRADAPEPLPPQDPQRAEVTALLGAWSRGEEGATESLMEAVYGALRQIAGSQFKSERSDHTLEPTALVHEAYLRLIDQKRVDWCSRRHFFAVAATVMRRILVDHARRRASTKRGSGLVVPLSESTTELSGLSFEVLALDRALDELARTDPRKASIIELHIFAGVSLVEAAKTLGCSRATVTRDWRLAKAWLYRELQAGLSHGS